MAKRKPNLPAVDYSNWREDPEALKALESAAIAHDPAAEALLPAVFRERPDMARRYADQVGTALAVIGKMMFADHGLTVRHQALLSQVPRDIARIAGSNPTPLEELLAARVVLTGLHVHWLELLYWSGKPGDGGKSSDHTLRHLQTAQRMHLNAIKALADLRRIAVSLQVNLADQQIVSNNNPN